MVFVVTTKTRQLPKLRVGARLYKLVRRAHRADARRYPDLTFAAWRRAALDAFCEQHTVDAPPVLPERNGTTLSPIKIEPPRLQRYKRAWASVRWMMPDGYTFADWCRSALAAAAQRSLR